MSLLQVMCFIFKLVKQCPITTDQGFIVIEFWVGENNMYEFKSLAVVLVNR